MWGGRRDTIYRAPDLNIGNIHVFIQAPTSNIAGPGASRYCRKRDPPGSTGSRVEKSKPFKNPFFPPIASISVNLWARVSTRCYIRKHALPCPLPTFTVITSGVVYSNGHPHGMHALVLVRVVLLALKNIRFWQRRGFLDSVRHFDVAGKS